jgi:hypothetical protein
MQHQQLSRALRPKGMNRISPIDSIEHVGELCRRNSNHGVGRRWPDELAALKAFGIERHTQPVMPKNFDQITFGAAEDIKIARVRISLQRFLYLQSQAIHPAPLMPRTA